MCPQNASWVNDTENMKAGWVASVMAVALGGLAGAEESKIIEAGPHHRVMQVVREEVDLPGEVKPVTHRWQELATGLNRWDDATQSYVPAEVQWEQLDTGHVIARKTAHQLILSPQLGAEGAVELWGPDNLHLRSSVLGIGVIDPATGQSYLLAQPKEEAPIVLSSPTDAWIEDAFDTIKASLRYRLRRDGVEQDLVLREQLTPELLQALDLDPKNARVFLMTEFFQPPAPALTDTTSVTPSGQMLADAVIDFGGMQMGPGQAFAEEDAENGTPARVGKEWKKLDGRQFLIESIPYEDLAPLMEKLPSPDQARLDSIKSKVRRTASLPKPRLLRQANAPRFEQGRLNLGASRLVSASSEPRTYASLRGPGATLDYQLLSSTSTLTLRGDVTYYVSDAVNVSSSLVIEGGAVVKATNSPTAGIVCSGTVACLMDANEMAVFTSKDDNTVGESIPGSTANPWTNYCASAGLELRLSGQNLHHLRFAHLRRGLFFFDYSAGTANTVSHAQFVHCGTAVQANGYGNSAFANLNLRNVLIHDATNAIYGYSLIGRVEHLTAHRCTTLAWDYNGTNYGTTSTLYLTNSLLVNVSGDGNMNVGKNYTTTESYSNRIFQTVGAGGFYHLNGTYRGNGTTNINATLATELKSLTTYPPVVMSNVVVNCELTLGLRVPRNTGLPDRGYHYQPIDVAACQVTITNAATLLLTNSTAIATFGDAGLVLENGGALIAEGTPLNPVRLFRYNLLQEQSLAWGSTNYQPNAIVGPGHNYVGPAPTVALRFTRFDGLANYGYHVYGGNAWFLLGSLTARDCEFRNQRAEFGGGTGTSISLYNNLFRRVQSHYYAWPHISAYNNLFWAGTNRLERFNGGSSGVWTFRDNTFHDNGFYDYPGGITNSHNAFLGIGQAQFAATQGSNVVLTNGFTYTNGPLGGYYHLSTNLFNAGSRSASLAGLYHSTTLASQTKETNSTVDIGWHRMALVNGAAADTDGDGLADYLEDSNGDGDLDSGEWNFNSTDTNPGNGLGDLQEFELKFNILVNDPAQDYGNEQNTQWQPKVVAKDQGVTVAFWDTNLGVYGLGAVSGSEEIVNRMVGWAVSVDGGSSFADRGQPPLPAPISPDSLSWGDAGDPVLAIDRVSDTIYFAGTSERRPVAYRGVPLWKSTDAGQTFVRCDTVHTNIANTDYPWLAVDDWPAGQTCYHDVYLLIRTLEGTNGTVYLMVAKDGNVAATNWTQKTVAGYGATMQTVAVGPDHVAYVAWTQASTNQQFSLRMRAVGDRGENLNLLGTDPKVICQLASIGDERLKLLRNDSSSTDDYFDAYRVPELAVNPAKPGHVYVAFTDRGSATDKADVFFTYSTDGGQNWLGSGPQRIDSLDGNPVGNDQWAPVLAVRPDGQQLLAAWFDRRNDTANSLIELYGRWATIATNGTVTWGNQVFRISTESFPPVYPGSLAENTVAGHYDPVWPPNMVNLDWWYSWWPSELTTAYTYSHWMGEHSGAFGTQAHAFVVWPDGRRLTPGSQYYAGRNQLDIRLARITWPNL